MAGRLRRVTALLTSVALVFGSAFAAHATDASTFPISSAPSALYDPSKFEVRGGLLASSWGPESGTLNGNGEVVFPRFFSLPGWEDMLIPRLHVGGMLNLAGKTDYGYAGALWTVNYDHYLAEFFFGGAVHDGPLISHSPDEASYGCRELYHVGANVGYRFDSHWSAMVTFDHASDGRPTLSHCAKNTGFSLVGVRVGYSF